MKSNFYDKPTLAVLAVILTLILGACSSLGTPTPTADVSIFYTQAASTIAADLTSTALAMPSDTPTASPTPIPTATPTLIPTPGTPATPAAPAQPAAPLPTQVPVNPATAFGCYNASYVSDVTIQYAPQFKPGDHFTKTWRVKNTGSCDWPRGFKIAFLSGDRFGADTTVIDQKVITGATADISLNMIAPTLTGVVTSNWQLTTDIGKPFGPVLPVSITLPGNTALPAGTVTTGGCLSSVLLADVTIPTGTELNTGETFTKTWRVKNTGTCAWNRDFKFTFVGGDLLGSDTTKIRQVVGPDGILEFSLAMTAPGTTGVVSTAWQMASDTGQLFGQLFAFSITVK